MEEWIRGLPEAERTALLVRFVAGGDAHLRAGLLRKFREERSEGGRGAAPEPRTVGELREGARRRATERRRKEAERIERERAGEARRAAAARKRHIEEIARREPEAWREVDELVLTSKPKCYDQAVVLLKDLRDVEAARGTSAGFRSRLLTLMDSYARRSSFLQRLEEADLV